MVKPTFDLEKKLLGDGYRIIIGIDEAGRGPLAGPVVASAVALRDYKFSISGYEQFELIRDSKALSAKQREKVVDFIKEHFYVGVGICDHQTIDRINILEASFLAMKKAITDLARILEIMNTDDEIILVDGNKLIPNLSHKQKAIIGGDKLIKSISAASIVAKVTRDKIMMEMHEKYPDYRFDKHKGYGTKLHMEIIQKYGPSPIHRWSFEPMKSLAKKKV